MTLAVKTLNLLVIDDHSETQKIIKMSLEMIKSWKVIGVSNFDSAIAQIKQNQFDLILIDYLMPELSGEEVAKSLRKNLPTLKTPIIFLTAHSLTNVNWQDLDVKGVIHKPFNPLTLGDEIEAILSNY